MGDATLQYGGSLNNLAEDEKSEERVGRCDEGGAERKDGGKRLKSTVG